MERRLENEGRHELGRKDHKELTPTLENSQSIIARIFPSSSARRLPK